MSGQCYRMELKFELVPIRAENHAFAFLMTGIMLFGIHMMLVEEKSVQVLKYLQKRFVFFRFQILRFRDATGMMKVVKEE